MATLKKAVLKQGTYHSPDGEVRVTRERLRHWQDTFRKMREASQVIPISWDHGTRMEDLTPLSLDEFSRSAQHTIGKLVEFAIDADGTAAELTVEVTDPTAEGRAARNEVFVSPVILAKWRDGAGNEYQDCITHVDLVNHPVDHSQGPFTPAQPDAIACALRLGLSTRVYRMAKAATDGSGNSVASDYHWITTADGDKVLAPPKSGSKKRGKGSRSGRKAKGRGKRMSLVPFFRLAEDSPPPDDSNVAEATESYDDMDEILDLLEQNYSIVLPEDTDDSNVWERLKTALLTAAAHKGGADDGDEGGSGSNVKQEDPDIATMSAASRTALAYAETMHRDGIAKRLDELLRTGRCLPREMESRKSQLSTVKLSLNASGQHEPGELEKWIESREAIPAGACWDDQTRTRMSSVAAATIPAHARNADSPEETQELVDFALGRKKR